MHDSLKCRLIFHQAQEGRLPHSRRWNLFFTIRFIHVCTLIILSVSGEYIHNFRRVIPEIAWVAISIIFCSPRSFTWLCNHLTLMQPFLPSPVCIYFIHSFFNIAVWVTWCLGAHRLTDKYPAGSFGKKLTLGGGCNSNSFCMWLRKECINCPQFQSFTGILWEAPLNYNRHRPQFQAIPTNIINMARIIVLIISRVKKKRKKGILKSIVNWMGESVLEHSKFLTFSQCNFSRLYRLSMKWILTKPCKTTHPFLSSCIHSFAFVWT